MKKEKKEQVFEATADSEAEVPKKIKFYNHSAFIAIALVLTVILIFFAIVWITTSTKKITIAEFFGIGQERLDYKNDDLDSYIDIKEEDYKGYEIKLDVIKPTYDIDVESHIMNLIYKNINKTDDVLDGAAYKYNQSIRVGDKLFFFYAGYELDEDGNRKEIISLTNYAYYDDSGYCQKNEDSYELFIGQKSSDFPLGFEVALVGLQTVKKEPGKEIYNNFEAKFNGKVEEDEVVYLCLSYIDEHGIFHDSENLRIDLREESTEEEWGIGFYNFLREYNIGMTAQIPGFQQLETEKGSRFYTSLKINYTTKCETEENITTIKVIYPHDWSDESLRGKTVYFDLVLEKTVNYKTAEFNDAFVTDVLEIEAEELSSYEGETLADKYKTRYFEQILEQYRKTCDERAREMLWDKLRENIEFTALPKYEYEISHSIQYNQYKSEYEELMQGDNDYYKELDDYIAESLGVETEDAGDALRAYVKDSIYEKLIIFSVLRAEDLMPKNDEEYKAIYQNELRLDYEYYIESCEDAGSEPEYKTIEEYDAFINEYYGAQMYENLVYYNYATSKMLEMITIVY